MEATTTKNPANSKIHPLVAGAAVSVMLASLTGVAVMTGLIPSSHGTGHSSTPAPISAANAPAVATAASSPSALIEPQSQTNKLVESQPAPASPAAERPDYSPRAAEKPVATQPGYHNTTPVQAAQAPAICHSCGHVESVQAIRHQAAPSGVGMVAGAVLGGILGHQVGGGTGRKIATVAGAVGGGYAGNEVEKRTRGNTTYEVRVRMEDGKVRSFPYAQQPGWNVGDRVRVVHGHLTSGA